MLGLCSTRQQEIHVCLYHSASKYTLEMGSDTALAQRFALYSFSSDNFFVYLTAWIISAIRDISIIL